ncbi:MarR family winged helix-turn-helix transcriptional regulator [Oceanicola sp. S124]|uniref:MarR family winged helix-turn-helix transcriptional regulator n=1 Tax=Oceanicola sp. S124 TaxID=1042378 RepID=UPI00025599F5|nr:MarR family transcriptional regulator [Oceanicola sp. S124]
MENEVQQMVGHLVRRLQQRATRLFHDRVRVGGQDLTSVQFAALYMLHRQPGLDQARLAEVISYDRATIGGVVERLEKRGLLKREVNRQDRRARLLRLTEAGAAAVEALLPEVRAIQDDILANLDAGERATVHRLLAKSLGQEADPQEG